jgi:uncharacterized protein involved in exopolysaccharide biosynthesis
VKTLICIMSLSLLLMWPACNASLNDDHPQDRRDAERARQERQVYRDRAAAKLRELDRQIDALRERLARGTERQRRDLDPQLAEMERKREFAHQKLEKFETSSQEAWVDMKAGIDAAMDDLEAAYKRADSHFR